MQIVELRYTTPVSVNPVQQAEYLDFAKSAARAAGAVILPYFRSGADGLGLENKLQQGFDPVTLADRQAEQVIRQHITERYPEHGIYGEEFGLQSGDGLTWVIDPIDGTRAFMSGMLHWGVLLALFDGEKPIVGVLYQPYTDELFFGDGSSAGFQRGDQEMPLNTGATTDLAQSILCTTGTEWLDQDAVARYQNLASTVQLSQRWRLLSVRAGGNGANAHRARRFVKSLRHSGAYPHHSWCRRDHCCLGWGQPKYGWSRGGQC